MSVKGDLPFVLIIVCALLAGCSVLAGDSFTENNDDLPYVPSPDTSVRLPVGMNLHGLTYYSRAPVFTDAMTTASNLLTFYTDEPGSPWNTGLAGEIEKDRYGYPLSLPQRTSDGHNSHVRFLINNYYKGRYRIFYEGEGLLIAGGDRLKEDDKGLYIDLTGTGSNTWIDIRESTQGNPLRNIHIIPEEYGLYSSSDYSPDLLPVFLPPYLEGLAPFHALRFMDWINTNNSVQVDWGIGSSHNATPDDYSDDRITKDHYSQATGRGISFDYAIELCNELHADAWVCIPHMASDDYIRHLARLWRDNLDSGLTIYLEFSNEMWNWIFDQAHWIDGSGAYQSFPEPVDSYVKTDLEYLEIHGGFPEQDAYMMARAFSLWSEEFGSEFSSRVVRVATGQHAWPGNSRRLLNYLYRDDAPFGAVGCDALAVGGYFSFSEENHDEWLTLGNDLAMEQIYRDTYENFLATSKVWTEESAAIAADFGIDYLVYEGGQHMQPWRQGSQWSYNQRLWDFQINERMYDLYMHNFDVHAEPDVNCKLFMAFSYIGVRESQYGSWGHLESLGQVGTNYADAPKYRALLDVNTAR